MLSFNSLFGDGLQPNLTTELNPWALITLADEIWAVDIDTGTEILIHGCEREVKRPLRIALDAETDELVILVGLVRVLKERKGTG